MDAIDFLRRLVRFDFSYLEDEKKFTTMAASEKQAYLQNISFLLKESFRVELPDSKELPADLAKRDWNDILFQFKKLNDVYGILAQGKKDNSLALKMPKSIQDAVGDIIKDHLIVYQETNPLLKKAQYILNNMFQNTTVDDELKIPVRALLQLFQNDKLNTEAKLQALRKFIDKQQHNLEDEKPELDDKEQSDQEAADIINEFGLKTIGGSALLKVMDDKSLTTEEARLNRIIELHQAPKVHAQGMFKSPVVPDYFMQLREIVDRAIAEKIIVAVSPSMTAVQLKIRERDGFQEVYNPNKLDKPEYDDGKKYFTNKKS